MEAANLLASQRPGNTPETVELITKQIDSLLDVYQTRAKKLDESSSPVVMGALGGCLGMLLGWVAMVASVPLALLLAAILSSLGIVLGVVLQKGFTKATIDRWISENQAVETELTRRIKALPIDAPSEVREGLWQQYQVCTEFLAEISRLSNVKHRRKFLGEKKTDQSEMPNKVFNLTAPFGT